MNDLALKHLAKMKETAAENIAAKVMALLADQWRPLKDAGWSDIHVTQILNDAVSRCSNSGR